MADIVESPARVPGWTLIRSGKSNKYRAPNGDIVGDYSYRRIYNEYKRTGVAPQSSGRNSSAPFSSHESSTNTISGTINEPPRLDVWQPDEPVRLDMPAPKPTPATKTAAGKYSAKDLSIGLQTALVIITSIVAVALQVPEAQMNEQEVKAIGIPLANIIEHSRYNQTVGRLVIGKSDYALLGYALYQYVDRVTIALREKKYGPQSKPAGANQPPQQPGAGNGATPSAPGVPLHYAPTGLRGFTPPV